MMIGVAIDNGEKNENEEKNIAKKFIKESWGKKEKK